jgi:NitT/TauT family transport system substrate-binding protein
MFNASPSTIAVDPAGPIRSPKDLEGKALIGHASDVALRTFSAFCTSTGVDRTRVTVNPDGGGMLGMVDSVIGSRSLHGVFAYVSTLDAAIAAGNRDPDRTVRHLRFAEHAPDLYGSALMVSRRMLREEPEMVRALVRGINRALADTAADPAVAIDALARRYPGLRREIDHRRLVGTLKAEMAHPEGARIGIGDMDDARLARLIARIVAVKKLPKTPAVAEIFDRAFLPPDGERIRSLAAK